MPFADYGELIIEVVTKRNFRIFQTCHEIVQSELGYIKYMDLLSQRYANPYLLLDDVIRLGQLHDFSIEVLQMIQKDRVQQRRWEYYLHKVWKDMSFDEYVAICEKTFLKKNNGKRRSSKNNRGFKQNIRRIL